MAMEPSAQAKLFEAASPNDGVDDGLGEFRNQFGIMARQHIRALVGRHRIKASETIQESQYQPASLDLRLGAKAYRIRASFLPGKNRTVADLLTDIGYEEMALDEPGCVLERGCVYLVPLIESLNLQKSISAVANPKSSTGRLDIFTRLITDDSEIFDHVANGYVGPLYAEVSPRSFSVRVRTGSRLNQIRFRRRNSQQLLQTNFAVQDRTLQHLHSVSRLVDGDLNVRDGLILRVALSAETIGNVVGYRAQTHTDVIDVDKLSYYRVDDYWETLFVRPDRRLILDPGAFYILASQERLYIPPSVAAEMVAIDPAMGEFRVHYAGFFDPGFGHTTTGYPGSRAVLEVRSHEVPFILEDGQFIGRLVYEDMAAEPEALYGQIGVSNYQGQDLKLSKHFKAP
ncbi:dCTP+deaminase,+dUMP-forming [Methylocapsa aurea]|uniref:2'-deoxycytidine 5'-triphosphate deaminase n=1 Tax=Methylocapsa aurea TaxID=663610 RepID=UPI003D18B0A7